MNDDDDLHFFVAPFDLDGESVGVGSWQISMLSPNWLGLCAEQLRSNKGELSWGERLPGIKVKLTCASGAAIGTVCVNDQVASSLLLLSGQSVSAESVLAQMFVESLRRTMHSRAHPSAKTLFEGVLNLKERPLLIVVPWPEAGIFADEHEMVRELGLHLAGAFFSKT
ncbi:MAG TPA: hypothetical protein VM260_14465 [Pirellula sp.]|nr:hypothetical protein [Pirellula sp.]